MPGSSGGVPSYSRAMRPLATRSAAGRICGRPLARRNSTRRLWIRRSAEGSKWRKSVSLCRRAGRMERGMLRSRTRLGGQAATLGVIVDWLGDPYQSMVCDGIERGAAAAGATLLFFVGGFLPAGAPNGAPRHQVYELAGRHNIDGLIVLSSTIGN